MLRTITALSVLLVAGLYGLVAYAQLPIANLASIAPAGAKQGAEIEVKIAGGDLDDVDKLAFSHQGITATAKMAPVDDFTKTPRPVPNTFMVKVDASVPPGLYEARAVSRYGMTNPRTFQVSTLNEIPEASTNTARKTPMEVAVGTIVNGEANNDGVDYYKLHLAAGQRVLVDCWAQRIDSRMDPSLVLYDASGREARRVHNSEGSDPVMEIQAQAESDFILGVYDFTYRGGGEYFYRLTIHNGPFIDFAFPPVGQPGAGGKFTLYGRNLPGGQKIDGMAMGGSQLEKLDVDIALPGDAQVVQRLGMTSLIEPHAGVVDSFSYQLNSPQGASNAISIGYASAPLIVEQEPANNDAEKPQAITLPCEYVGQFYPQGDRDWVSFEAKQGDVFWIDVISNRMGLPTDPNVVIEQVSKNEQGEVKIDQIAAMDDVGDKRRNDDNQPRMFDVGNRDPEIRFEAKAAGTYRVGVSDLYSDSRGDPRMVYRLVVRPEKQDFHVLVFTGAIPKGENGQQLDVGGAVLRRGESQALRVQVVREDGFEGEVEVVAEGLPPGVACSGALLGGKGDTAQLIFTANADAPAGASNVKITGRAKINGQDVVREARPGTLVWGSKNNEREVPFARMSRDLMLSVIDKETGAATISMGDGNPIETCLGAKVKVPVKVARHGEFKEAVKLKAAGLPQNAQSNEANIAGGDGEIELNLANQQIQPGTYTVYLAGQAKLKYARNPESLTKAKERQKELEDIVKEMTEKQKQAAEAAKAAREKATAAKDDQALADAAKKAEDDAKAMEEKRKEAENRKKQTDQEVQKLDQETKPKDVNLNVISTPVRLRIASSPVVVAAGAPGNKKQGEKFEMVVTVERKYGFDDQVEIRFEAPNGVGGVNAEKVNIPKGQNEGKLQITLAANATPGAHQFTLKGRSNFNGVQLDSVASIPLTIEAVEQKKE